MPRLGISSETSEVPRGGQEATRAYDYSSRFSDDSAADFRRYTAPSGLRKQDSNRRGRMPGSLDAP
jgi:hypothetical protein